MADVVILQREREKKLSQSLLLVPPRKLISSSRPFLVSRTGDVVEYMMQSVPVQELKLHNLPEALYFRLHLHYLKMFFYLGCNTLSKQTC